MRLRPSLLAIMACLLCVAGAATAQRVLLHNVHGYSVEADRLAPFYSLLFDATSGRVIARDADPADADARIDGRGATLLPGLADAHGHVLELGINTQRVQLRGLNREQSLLKVQQFARENPDLPWILGHGWNQVLWTDARFPHRSELDALGIDRPVWLSRVDGHAGWGNSAALQLAGLDVDSATASADAGVLRDADGRPTGVLIDNAMQRIESRIPPLGPALKERALRDALKALAASGLTLVHDAGVDAEVWRIYQRLARNGELPIRVYAMLSSADPALQDMLAAGPLNIDDRLVIRSVKLMLDGALGSYGAVLHEPYSDRPQTRGAWVQNPQQFEALLKLAVAHGFQANVHAIGDRANHVALTALSQPWARARELRHRVEHAQVVTPADWPLFAQHGILASMQPTHATSDMNMAGARLGTQRMAGAYAWQSLLQAGARIAAGSDFPVELHNPLYGLHAAVTRQDRRGQPPGGWHAEQAMTPAQALRAFTLDAAYAAHMESALGALQAGQWADFILLDADPMRGDPARIWQAQVLQVWVAGQRIE